MTGVNAVFRVAYSLSESISGDMGWWSYLEPSRRQQNLLLPVAGRAAREQLEQPGEPVGDWMKQAWGHIIRKPLGLPAELQPAWWGQLVRTRISVSTPGVLDWFRRFNTKNLKKPQGRQKAFDDCVKPFDFLEHAPLDPMRGRPPESDRDAPFTLVTADFGKAAIPARWVNIHDPAGQLYSVVGSDAESAGPHACISRSFGAVILCVDEKSQIQALDRTQPMLSMGLGYVEGVTHDDLRHAPRYPSIRLLNWLEARHLQGAIRRILPMILALESLASTPLRSCSGHYCVWIAHKPASDST